MTILNLNSYMKRFFRAYKELGGWDTKDMFEPKVREFFRLLEPSYTYGEGSKEDAWKSWSEYIGNDDNASLYFKAINSVHQFTQKSECAEKDTNAK